MIRAAAVAMSTLALVSCTSTVRDGSLRAPVTARSRVTAVDENIRRQVRNAVDAGEGDYRVRGLRERLATNPADTQARLELAEHYTRSGFPDVALEHLRFAALRQPDSAEVALALARSLHRQGLDAEARAGLESFVAAHQSTAADVWSLLGILQDSTGDYAAGESSHRAAITQRDASSPFHNNLGYNLFLQNRKSEAAAEFRRALDIDPSSLTARNNLGLALSEQPAEAVKQWQSATDPASAHNNLAAVLMEKGDYEGARRELELALGYRKDHPAALNNLQLLAEAKGGSLDLTFAQNQTSWQRFVRTLGLVFLGSDTESKTAAASGVNGQPASNGAGSQ